MIQSFERILIRNQKQKAIDNQVLADQLIRGIDLIINGSDKKEAQIKQVWDYYPDLFEDEKEFYYEQKHEDEFESFKNRRKRFANQYNKKYEGDGD